MISHKYRFICPRIGKNASSTLVDFFKKFDRNLIDEGHLSVLGDGFLPFLTSNYMAGQDHNRYFKFAFSRNPFDRLVSAFYEFRKPDQFGDMKSSIRNNKQFSLESILEEFPSFVEMTEKIPHIHWKSQKEMIHDKQGNILVGYVGKVENIRWDLFNICNVIGIRNFQGEVPESRKTKNRKKYTDYYDDKLRNKVAKIYKEDLDFFGYRFGILEKN